MLVLSAAPPLRAQSVDGRIRTQREELDRVRRERADLERRMANLQGNVHDLRDEVANLDRQHTATELVIQTLDRQLAAITADVEETTNRMAMAEGDLSYRRSALSKRLVDIYKRGPLYSAEALLTARSFGELDAKSHTSALGPIQDRVIDGPMPDRYNSIA